MVKPILEMKNITKRFPGVVANNKVNLTLYPGEVHALLGENGAGKSTLMNVLTGIYAPNEGELFFKGEKIELKSPKTAVDLGIGMVHQHFKLIEPLTVAENIYMPSKNCKFMLNLKEMNERITELSTQFNLPVDPKAKIWQLAVGEQQRVEIVKLLFNGAEILILDEPTAVLTPQESRALFANLRGLADEGKAVLFISHKLYEVIENADRITVLRGGESVATMLNKDLNQDDLVSVMVGKRLEMAASTREVPDVPKSCALKLEQVCAKNDKGLQALDNIDLELYHGEILGVAGVSGNGQRELCEAITGLRPVTQGSISLEGEEVTNAHPRKLIDKGVAYVPEDRMLVGLVGTMNMKENAILRDSTSPEISKHGILNQKAIVERTNRFVENHAIKHAGIQRPVSLMSGGNLQKLLLAREVNGSPDVIVAAYPVHGVDIGATNTIHEILLRERKRGAAILMISEDLEELFTMSDRIAVLFEGKITGIVDVPEQVTQASYDHIGHLMVGNVEAASGVNGGAEQ